MPPTPFARKSIWGDSYHFGLLAICVPRCRWGRWGPSNVTNVPSIAPMVTWGPFKNVGVWSGRLGHACTIAPLTSCPGCVPGMWRDALPTHRLPTIGPNINPPTHTAPHSIPPYFCKSVPHIKTLQQKQKSKNDTKQNTRHIGPDHNPDHY